MTTPEPRAISHPFAAAPPEGQVQEIAPGILWARFPLPFQLNHINLYFIQDDDGWAVLDAGIANDKSKEVWQSLLDGPLNGAALTKVIITHFHPDHVGLAGWLCETQNVPLLTTATTYLQTRVLSLDPDDEAAKSYTKFYTSHGMDDEGAQIVITQGHAYQRMVAPLPRTYLRLLHGDTLVIGKRRFQVLTANGHAPEQAMLYLPEEKLLFGADQVLARISPNVSVHATEPNGDPLGHYMRSLRQFSEMMPDDLLVLPGHELPFYGLHRRAQELVAHHEERCDRIIAACAKAPQSTAALTRVLFTRDLDPHQLSFAFTETLAHANRLVRRGDLQWIEKDGKLLCAQL